MPTLGKTKVSPSLISTGSLFLGTSSYAVTASYAMNGGSGGSGGSTQTGSIANQTVLYNVTTSQDNVISGLNLSSNKWGVTVVEEWNSGSIVGDDYYSSCSLLLHLNGSNGSTTFTDNSPSPKTVTANGTAQISTTRSKFGGASAYFNGSTDNLIVNNSSDFAFGTGNFTVEFWANWTAWTGNQRFILMGQSGASNIEIGRGSSTDEIYFYIMNSLLGTYTWNPGTNIWRHIALVRTGTGTNQVTLYIDGINVVSATSAANITANNIIVGGLNWAGSYNMQGYIDELRITKGVARYTSSFATQSIEFSNNTGSIQYATKYIGSIGGLNDSNVDYGVEKLSDSSLKIRKMSASGQPLSGSGTLSASVDRVYVNVLDYTNVMVTSSYALTASYVLGGIQTGSISNQTILYNVTTSQDNTITGLDLSGNKWDVSVIEEWNSGSVVGDQYYNSCSLLMHFSGSNGSTTFTDNSPVTKSFTVNGNSQISTAQSKFGSSSLYLDGTGDYLSTNSSNDFAFGTGDFTIECWFYSSNVGSKGLFQTSDTVGGLKTSYTSGIILLQGANNVGAGLSGGLCAAVTGTFLGSTTAVITTNTWYHIALVRYSGTSTIYLNGTSIGSASTTGNCSGTYLAIGGYYDTSYLYQGYMDEVRITKGVARYTGSFVTQSTAFLDSQNLNQLQTKYVGLVGGINDSNVDYGVEKLSDGSLKIRKMSATGQPLSGSGQLSASVDRVYVNVLNYKEVQTTAQSASYAVSASYLINAASGESFHPFLLG
jgi:hypothetical protein